MKEGWATKTWWHRLFATIFGIIVTNSFLAYSFEYEQLHHLLQVNPKKSYKEFLESLAYYLLNQDIVNHHHLRRRNINNDSDDEVL